MEQRRRVSGLLWSDSRGAQMTLIHLRFFRVGALALVLWGSVSSLYALDELEQLLFGESSSTQASESSIVPTSDALDVLLVDGIVEKIADAETNVTLPRLP